MMRRRKRVRLRGWFGSWHRVARRESVPSRRLFLAQGGGFLLAGLLWGSRLIRAPQAQSRTGLLPIRPPGAAHDDAQFRAACIRCGLCGVVCENACIRFFGIDEAIHGMLTPYLDVRQRSCTLCMKCTAVCPTGALTKIPEEMESIETSVSMGIAKVDPDRCLSYLGRICGYCHDACPLPNKAIQLIPPAKPRILVDGCVGCGRCVEFCPQTPTAIDVFRGEA